MYGLPENCIINKPLYKKAVFEKFNLKSAERDRFDADISKILGTEGEYYIIQSQNANGNYICPNCGNEAKLEELLDGCAWEKLPYNAAAGAKYKMLNMEYPLNQF